jgi:hypothetical protein
VKPVKFMTARSTVIGLLLAITLSLLAANIIPQRPAAGKPPAWLAALPEGLRFLGRLGLDDIVGSYWFAGLILLFSISLVLSTVAQYGVARALIGRSPQSAPRGEWQRVGYDPAGLAIRMSAAGYRVAGRMEGVERYVKHKSGYWGSFLLHLGLVVAVVFSLVYLLTQHKALVRLVGEEITRLTPENVVVKRGIMPLQEHLPYSMALTRLEPRFWSNGKLETLASELYIADRPGDLPRRVDVALSDKGHFDSFRVYQGNPFGLSFNLELSFPGSGFRREQLQLHYPGGRDSAGYGELAMEGTDLVLKGKFIPDAVGKTMEPRAPLLTLRLVRGEKILGEAVLKPGEKGQLGPWTVRLTRVEWWTEILLDGSRGMAGVFVGFAVILAGVLSSYCLVPREIMVREEGGAVLVQQYVRRFAPIYRDEFESVVGTEKRQGES